MNRKINMTLGAAVCSVLLVFTMTGRVWGAGSNLSYHFYQQALQRTMAAANYTGHFQVHVADNQAATMDVSSVVKLDRPGHSSSDAAAIESAGHKTEVRVYNHNGRSIVKTSDSEIYHVIPTKSNRELEQLKGNPVAGRLGNLIVNALIGNLKNRFREREMPNGERLISFQAAGRQIPALLNGVTSLLIKHGKGFVAPAKKKLSELALEPELKLPRLVRDIRISRAALQAAITGNDVLEDQTVNIEISGKDAGGKAHVVDLTMQMELGDFNRTHPDKIDLKGKPIRFVQA